MEKVTLDTNVIIDLIENRGDPDVVAILIAKHCSEKIDLAITTRVTLELGKTIEKLNEIVVLEELNSPFRFNMSKLSGKDILSTGSASEQIQKLLFPNAISNKTLKHRICDGDILDSHRRAKRDVLLTGDKDILRKSELLYQMFKIRVMSASEYVHEKGWITS
jgi:predicted nucleic acid-binding protein